VIGLVAIAAALASTPAGDKAEVQAAVDAFIAAINSGDAAALDRLTHDDGAAFIQGYVKGREGLRRRPNKESVERMKTNTSRFHERYWNPTILVHRDIAHFWAPYSFDIDGKRSHCGVDSFNLARVGGQWILTSNAWTVEPPETSCAALGEPKQ
jgi:ketosteroid isomerase-like protein